ncbi:alginate export family protein [Lysobacter koreensis]|uniref:Alginate export family protein n=1 Tax=Lysobacter koreensis TaxID=266122 RepID=A0ABW2YHC1_9GAMM
MSCRHGALPALLLAACALPAAAGDVVQPQWNLRLRHEHVADDAFARNAGATTLRLRAGLRFAWADHWQALAEAEGVAADGRYNSGANGRVGHPGVADPAGAELNQLWLGWHGERAKATAGRQRVQLDNQRWLGNSGWRQNEQTFDAVALEWTPVAALTARYVWLDRVHRVNGDDARDPLARERDLDSHALDLAFAHNDQQWGGYALAHEDRDVPAASTLTAGVRWSGQYAHDGGGNRWGWRVEAARQRDHAGNPHDFAHAYWLFEPSLVRRGVTWRAGWEHLGGDGRHALQTPLASLHPFNGWADKFGVTPAGGLDDRYLAVAGKLGRGAHAGKLSWTAAWHDYRADSGGRYGREWNASLGFPVRGPVTGLVKLADYRSDGFARDTTKLWLQLEWTRP